MLKLSKKTLLLPYIPAYILLCLAIADTFLLNTTLKNSLPSSIQDVFMYYIIFDFPHIIASFLMFAEKTYREAYAHILYKKMVLVGLGSIILLLTVPSLFFILSIAYTLHHVIQQQFGIAKFYDQTQSNVLTFLRYTFTIVGCIGFIGTTTTINTSLLTAGVGFGILGVVVYFLFHPYWKKNIYLTLFVLSFLCACILFGMGYALFGLLAIRVVHDITAFMFYGAHNYNRSKDGNNILFTAPLIKKIHPGILTVIYALLINTVYLISITIAVDWPLILFTLFVTYQIISILHYYMEGRIWKKDSLARNYIYIKE